MEAAKHRQAKEIRDLRRKLRESRLILPPRTYQAVKSEIDKDDLAEDDEDDEDGEDEETEDQAYARIKSILDRLIETGRRAVELSLADMAEQRGGAKVLSAYDMDFKESHGDITLDLDKSFDHFELESSGSLPVTPAPNRLHLAPEHANEIIDRQNSVTPSPPSMRISDNPLLLDI